MQFHKRRKEAAMIEMPEAYTLASQMNQKLAGKTFTCFVRGNQVHKFLWLNRPDADYQSILAGKTITGASSFGRSIYLFMGGEAMLWWGDVGGRILYHAAGEALPKGYHLGWEFSDGSRMTFSLQMWGYVRLLEAGEFGERPHDETGTPPLDPAFSFDLFDAMLEQYPEKTSKGVKGFLVATQYVMPDHIAGLGNAYVQDILFRAGLDPRRKTPTLTKGERRRLFDAVNDTMRQAITLGGREEERDLFNRPGGYKRLMDSSQVGLPCSACGTAVRKIAYLGGSCYLCPQCQK